MADTDPDQSREAVRDLHTAWVSVLASMYATLPDSAIENLTEMAKSVAAQWSKEQRIDFMMRARDGSVAAEVFQPDWLAARRKEVVDELSRIDGLPDPNHLKDDG